MVRPMWAPPQQFDEYRLVGSLGRGAMGQVYVAHDELLDRQVAIKFVGNVDDGIARARFRNEARAIARLQHPNVVAVYRIGEVVGQPYIVSELVRGQTLAKLAVPVDEKLGLKIAIDLARGLAAAHRHGVLHRDIKPSNAILGDDGSTKLLDFGLAKLSGDELQAHALVRSERRIIDADANGESTQDMPAARAEHSDAGPILDDAKAAGLTATDAIVGTPLYRAPECWKFSTASPASDIYSLGAVMFYLFAGHPPHQAESLSALGACVMTEQAPELSSIMAIDRELSALVARCLALDPDERFASAARLCEALEALGGHARRVASYVENPYRGLLPFGREHRALCFGRATESRNLAERLRSESFVLVAGDSGVGKSSVCRAGVIPVFADANPKWMVRELVPGRRPRQAILDAIADALAMDDANALADQPALVLRQRPELRAGGILLFIDQLEQLVTTSDAEEAADAAALVEQLCEVPGVKILATVRSDYLADLATLGTFGDTISRGLYLLPRMNAEAIRAAITEPARLFGVQFESPELVERLVAAASSLPLLQFTLAELWDARDQESKKITARALEQLGGVDGALAWYADNVLERLRFEERAIARTLLTSLVDPDGKAISRDASELTRSSPDGRRVLEALVRGRLITATEGERGAVYSIAGDALLTGWGTLVEWLDTDAFRRRQRARVEELARDWARLGKPRDQLLPASRLRELRTLDRSELSDTAAALLAASQRARLAKWIASGLVLATVVGLVGGAIVFARRADERERANLISERHAHAKRLLDEVRGGDARTQELRRDAFGAFDRGDDAIGEKLWEQARTAAHTTSQQRLQATLFLEATLTLAPSDPVTRSMLASVLDQRASEADREGDEDARSELLARLEAVAPESIVAWKAPARLVLQVKPEIAGARLERYVREATGRLVVETVGDWPAHEELAPGSYRLILNAPRHAPVVVPLVLARGESKLIRLDLPKQAAVPDGFVYVPEGQVQYGSTADEDIRSAFFKAVPMHRRSVGAFLIARRETTFAQWIEFLEQVPPAERDRRMPRPGTWGKVALTRSAPNAYELTMTATNAALRARTGEQLGYERRDRRQRVDWMKLPVSGISTDDAVTYTRWLAATGRVPGARLCTELEWERAARGADDRPYPHGYTLMPDDANFLSTYGAGAGPDEVGAHPASRSPFGVDDLTGNVFEFTTHATRAGSFVARGGGFFFDSVVNQIANRTEVETDMLGLFAGLRVCANPPR